LCTRTVFVVMVARIARYRLFGQYEQLLLRVASRSVSTLPANRPQRWRGSPNIYVEV
jgi:hypothetical protein